MLSKKPKSYNGIFKDSRRIYSRTKTDTLRQFDFNFVETMYTLVKDSLPKNRAPRSIVNWRFTKEETMKGHNRSPEKILEKRLVRISPATWPDVANWANQVPVASGVLNSTVDKKTAVDWVHKLKRPNAYEFIELKIASDNPLHAGLEILEYGMAYILARQKPEFFFPTGTESPEVMKAGHIELKVLAPEQFYDFKVRGSKISKEYWIDFQSTTNRGLAKLRENIGLDFRIEFNFETFQLPESKIRILRTGLFSDNDIIYMIGGRKRIQANSV